MKKGALSKSNLIAMLLVLFLILSLLPTAAFAADPLPAPENTVISVNASSGKPTLTWDAVAGASGYEVYRTSSKNGSYTRFSTVSKTEYTNTTTEAGKTYYYKVRALCKNSAYGDGAFSSVKSATCKYPASGSTTHSTVYIGATGTKYHRESCSTLNGNGRPISLSDALTQGRAACKVCKP